VLFSSHLLCLQHFLSYPLEVSPEARVETGWLSHAVKNAWASQRFAGFARDFTAPLGVRQKSGDN
jgi:hypothetical protein